MIALGVQAAKIGRRLGLRLPVYPVKGYSVTLPLGTEPPLHGGVDETTLTAFLPIGARLRLTSIAEFSGYDTAHKPRDFEPMLNTARELFPGGADWSKPTYWAGLRPMTPEGTPILGRAKQRNVFLNVGHGHMGWTMACGSARIVADELSGRIPEIDTVGMTLA